MFLECFQSWFLFKRLNNSDLWLLQVRFCLTHFCLISFVTHCTACFPYNQCWVIFTKDNIRYYELYTVIITN